MSILPEGEDLRKAIKWIDEILQDKTDKSISELICEASLKFDLPPNDQEFLFRNFTNKN
ncbi:MAG: hypothetical protein HF978_08620 [Desulfobacteraceae bacterium]|nr:hypothetical protein [Desulfobacteraceae bacterium]MBC2755595.1 hypothetical protein [Desulfobacteraceae bacterium]